MPAGRGKIDSVEFTKSGNGKNGPWTMYKVMVDGQRYTSFDSSLQAKIGQIVEFEYTSEIRQGQRGEYEAKTIVTPRNQPYTPPAQPSAYNPVPARPSANNTTGQQMLDKLDLIYNLLLGWKRRGEECVDYLTGQPTEQENGQDEITDSDIPF